MGDHVHKWGPWFRLKVVYGIAYRLTRYRKQRLCTDGWCSLGQWGNGRTFAARPERKTP